MEAIILAGGLGTRLKTITQNEIPKTMVDVGGVPFLKFLLYYLAKQNIIKKVILSVGFKHEVIQEYFGLRYKDMDIEYVVEKKPLGTGGAVKRSLRRTQSPHIFIFNGDTFFNIDLREFQQFHNSRNLDISIALKKSEARSASRFGNVKIKENKIIAFSEKSQDKASYINGGAYIMRNDLLESFDMPDVFSFEVDFLQKNINNVQAGAFICDDYFIDIGIPEDYKRAQKELKEYVS